MSSTSSNYGSYIQASKGAYTSRPSTSSSTYSTASSSSLYAQSANSSRGKRYGKPPVVINGGGQINDPNTSSSAPNGGYYN